MTDQPAWQEFRNATHAGLTLKAPSLTGMVEKQGQLWLYHVVAATPEHGETIESGTGPTKRYCKARAVAAMEKELNRCCQEALGHLT